jgi:hypothetical protein
MLVSRLSDPTRSQIAAISKQENDIGVVSLADAEGPASEGGRYKRLPSNLVEDFAHALLLGD